MLNNERRHRKRRASQNIKVSDSTGVDQYQGSQARCNNKLITEYYSPGMSRTRQKTFELKDGLDRPNQNSGNQENVNQLISEIKLYGKVKGSPEKPQQENPPMTRTRQKAPKSLELFLTDETSESQVKLEQLISELNESVKEKPSVGKSWKRRCPATESLKKNGSVSKDTPELFSDVKKGKNRNDDVDSIHENQPVCLSPIKANPKKASPKKDMKSPRKGQSKNMCSFDLLISEIKECKTEKENTIQFQKQVDLLATPTKILMPIVRDDEILEKKPCEPKSGVMIIDHTKHLRFFTGKSYFQSAQGCFGESNAVLACLQKYKGNMLSAALAKNLINDWNCKQLVNRDCIKFLFFLMSVEENVCVASGCNDALLRIAQFNFSQESSSEFLYVSDLITALLNYGCVIEEHCPLRNMFILAENQLYTKWKSTKSKKEQSCNASLYEHKKVLDLYNLSLSFNLFAQLARLSAFKDEQLAQIVTLLCWLRLDEQTNCAHDEIQACTVACLQSITEIGWKNQWLLQLCVKLSELTGKPEDILIVCSLLPPVDRAQELRQCLSYKATHICLKAPFTFKPVIKPEDLLNLLKAFPLDKLKSNCQLLGCTAKHVDIAVGNNIERKHRKHLAKLGQIVKLKASRLPDSAMSLQFTQVKNALYTISCKWSVIVQELSERK